MSNLLTSDTGRAFLQATAAIFAALISAAVVWAKDLNISAKRTRALDEAIKRVEFWNKYLTALAAITASVEDEKQIGEHELRAAAAVVHAMFHPAGNDQDTKFRPAGVSKLRWSLMLFKVTNGQAKKKRSEAYRFLIGGTLFFPVLHGVLFHPFFPLDRVETAAVVFFPLCGVIIWLATRAEFRAQLSRY